MASPKVMAAGHAAASWARARRATWTSVPLPRPVAPPTAVAQTAAPKREPLAPAAPARIAHAQPAAPLDVETIRWPEPVTEVKAPKVKQPRPPLGPWVWRGAIGVAAIAAVAAAAPYLLRMFGAAREKVAGLASAPPTNAGPAKTTGSLRITSTPEGARVLVDGKARGTTPVTVEDLAFGEHTIVLESAKGTVHRTVIVTSAAVGQLDEQIFDGWVAIFSPIEVTVSEDDRVLRPDERGEIMLPPGTHRLRFTNRALALDAVRAVEIKPGEKTALTFTPPASSVSVTANDAAEVFLDGTKLGATPLSAASATLGTHELVVRRASGGERRMTITVTAKPFTVNVDF